MKMEKRSSPQINGVMISHHNMMSPLNRTPGAGRPPSDTTGSDISYSNALLLYLRKLCCIGEARCYLSSRRSIVHIRHNRSSIGTLMTGLVCCTGWELQQSEGSVPKEHDINISTMHIICIVFSYMLADSKTL